MAGYMMRMAIIYPPKKRNTNSRADADSLKYAVCLLPGKAMRRPLRIQQRNYALRTLPRMLHHPSLRAGQRESLRMSVREAKKAESPQRRARISRQGINARRAHLILPGRCALNSRRRRARLLNRRPRKVPMDLSRFRLARYGDLQQRDICLPSLSS